MKISAWAEGSPASHTKLSNSVGSIVQNAQCSKADNNKTWPICACWMSIIINYRSPNRLYNTHIHTHGWSDGRHMERKPYQQVQVQKIVWSSVELWLYILLVSCVFGCETGSPFPSFLFLTMNRILIFVYNRKKWLPWDFQTQKYSIFSQFLFFFFGLSNCRSSVWKQPVLFIRLCYKKCESMLLWLCCRKILFNI